MEKITAVYAVEKKLGGKNGVRFPSDNLSAKEKRALNGECVTYDISTFNKPTTWETLRSWPDDIQRDYLKRCYCTRKGTTRQIADMLGVCYQTVWNHMDKLGVPMRGKGSRQTENEREAWQVFLKGGQTLKDAIPEETKKQMWDMVTEQEPIKEPLQEVIVAKKEPPKTEPKVELKFEPKPELKPAEGNRILAIAALLEQLKGSGAKISLEVVL